MLTRTAEQRLAYKLLSLYPGVDIDVQAAAALTCTTATQTLRRFDDLPPTASPSQEWSAAVVTSVAMWTEE